MSRYKNGIYSQGILVDSINNRRYYPNLLLPNIPEKEDDIYVITVSGDRFDLLSAERYGDPQYWWIISAANPSIRKDSYFIEPGLQIRIPANYQQILQETKIQNLNR